MARIDRVTFVASVQRAEADEDQARTHATAFFAAASAIESADRRSAALAEALWMVSHGVSQRAGARLAGVEGSLTGLQRYFTVAKAVNDGHAVPVGFESWSEAFGAMSLRQLVEMVRPPRTAKSDEPIQKRAERDVQRLVNMLATLTDDSVDKAGVPNRPFYIANLAEWLGAELVKISEGVAPYWDLTRLMVVGTTSTAAAADDDDSESEPAVEMIARSA